MKDFTSPVHSDIKMVGFTKAALSTTVSHWSAKEARRLLFGDRKLINGAKVKLAILGVSVPNQTDISLFSWYNSRLE